MSWTAFWIFVGVMAVLYVLNQFFTQRKVAVMSMMLYRQGDVDGYLKELDHWTTKFMFSKNLRRLMLIDAYMAKDDIESLKALFDEIDGLKIPDGDRMTVLQKEIPFYLNLNEVDKVKEVYAKMNEIYARIPEKKKKKSNYDRMMQEMKYLLAIHVDQDGSYAKELFDLGESLKDDIPSGVYFFKAAQSYYLLNNKAMVERSLNKAKTRLVGTPMEEKIKELLATKKYAHVMETRL